MNLFKKSTVVIGLLLLMSIIVPNFSSGQAPVEGTITINSDLPERDTF